MKLPAATPYAFVTLLMRARYAALCECMNRSLARTTHHPLIVIHGNRTLVAGYPWHAGVEELQQRLVDGRRLYEWRHFSAMIRLKFLAWTLTEYERLVFLDADTYVNRDISGLFATPLAAPIAAAPCNMDPRIFNSGVMVFRPSRREARALMAQRARRPACERRVTDQSILNTRYAHPNWTALPESYNYARRRGSFRDRRAVAQHHVWHATAEPKPNFCAARTRRPTA